MWYFMVISWWLDCFQMINHHIILWLTLIEVWLTMFQLCSQQLGHFQCISKRPEILMDISFGVVFTYLITRNELLFSSKWSIWNPYRFEFHYASFHVNTNKELTAHLRFSTEMKSHTSLSSFRLSCEHTLSS